ncbi:HAD family hydrolase [Gammaproteobacteria bacterium]|jgi:putative hydrolase of the HAD superfamily|nr:HAD family hydrolase [Gammaproteobacteria bacterium]
MLELKDLMLIDLSMVQGILIDIDDTLYSYAKPHQLALNICYREFNKLYPDLCTKDKFNQSYRDSRTYITTSLNFSGSCRSRLLAFQNIFENLKSLPPINAYQHALKFEELYWSEFINRIERNDSMFKFLNHCHLASAKICAVSDMQTSFQIRKLIKLGYKNLHLVTSEEVGVEKPNPLIFKKALHKIGCDANKTIMIGDNFEKDIIGAEKLGIQAFQVSLND